jgi:hypothetical protein
MQAAVRFAIALLVAAASTLTAAGRCAACATAPCCRSEPTKESHVRERMPCCADAKDSTPAVRTPGTVEELLSGLAPVQVAFGPPAIAWIALRLPVAFAPRARRVYQEKCSLLL